MDRAGTASARAGCLSDRRYRIPCRRCGYVAHHKPTITLNLGRGGPQQRHPGSSIWRRRKYLLEGPSATPLRCCVSPEKATPRTLEIGFLGLWLCWRMKLFSDDLRPIIRSLISICVSDCLRIGSSIGKHMAYYTKQGLSPKLAIVPRLGYPNAAPRVPGMIYWSQTWPGSPIIVRMISAHSSATADRYLIACHLQPAKSSNTNRKR